MKAIYLNIIILIIINLSLSYNAGAQEVRSFSERLESIRSECMDKAQDFTCNLESKIIEPANYKSSSMTYFQTYYVHRMVSNLLLGIPLIVEIVSGILYAPGNLSNDSFLLPNRVKDFNILLLELKEVVKNKNLSECQKACLTVCTTSRLLTYKIQKPGRVSRFKAVEDGYGRCMEYSKLANNIGDFLELTIHRDVSKLHAFVKIKIDNKWQIVEPQDGPNNFNQCNLMKDF